MDEFVYGQCMDEFVYGQCMDEFVYVGFFCGHYIYSLCVDII